jgi:hypothetical protein
MVFLVVVFLSMCVCVCCARCNEDLFFKEKSFCCFYSPLLHALFCLCFDLIIFSRHKRDESALKVEEKEEEEEEDNEEE